MRAKCAVICFDRRQFRFRCSAAIWIGGVFSSCLSRSISGPRLITNFLSRPEILIWPKV
jgi:hypothetical protein